MQTSKGAEVGKKDCFTRPQLDNQSPWSLFHFSLFNPEWRYTTYWYFPGCCPCLFFIHCLPPHYLCPHHGAGDWKSSFRHLRMLHCLGFLGIEEKVTKQQQDLFWLFQGKDLYFWFLFKESSSKNYIRKITHKSHFFVDWQKYSFHDFKKSVFRGSRELEKCCWVFLAYHWIVYKSIIDTCVRRMHVYRGYIISHQEKQSLSIWTVLISGNWQWLALKGSWFCWSGTGALLPPRGSRHRCRHPRSSGFSQWLIHCSSPARPRCDVRRASWEGHTQCRSRSPSGTWLCSPGRTAAGRLGQRNQLP